MGFGRRLTLPTVLLAALLSVSGCGWVSGLFGGGEDEVSTGVSVFDVAVGQCFQTPTEEKVELVELPGVPCDTEHRQESYAIVDYQAPTGADADLYPGKSALTSFADGSCAEAFEKYVGISYLDSSLYFTYLLPSARGWEQGEDRSVICFVISTGQPLKATVRGSKL